MTTTTRELVWCTAHNPIGTRLDRDTVHHVADDCVDPHFSGVYREDDLDPAEVPYPHMTSDELRRTMWAALVDSAKLADQETVNPDRVTRGWLQGRREGLLTAFAMLTGRSELAVHESLQERLLADD